MIISPQCFDCIHLDRKAPRGIMRCPAFPDGIPEAILLNEHDHEQPYEGDHGVRFEPTDAYLREVAEEPLGDVDEAAAAEFGLEVADPDAEYSF